VNCNSQDGLARIFKRNEVSNKVGGIETKKIDEYERDI